MRTQKDIVQCISTNVGTGKVKSVEKSAEMDKLFECKIDPKYIEAFKLNLDMKPSALIVGEAGEEEEEDKADLGEEDD